MTAPRSLIAAATTVAVAVAACTGEDAGGVRTAVTDSGPAVTDDDGAVDPVGSDPVVTDENVPSDVLPNDVVAGDVDATALRLDQPWRPAIHYAPPYGWMNDPNGLSYVDGRYHLFFQYNPLDVDFGDIGWGHAVSDNLVDWETWPVAIEPEPDQLIFSGSLVNDVDGTSPLCEPDQEPSCLVAVYTTDRTGSEDSTQTQDIAVSDRAGIEFTKYEGNPVIDLGSADFRDPKVFWHEGTARWIMVVVLPIDRQVVLFGSPDLVVWEELSRFGPLGAIDGIWECPDLFPAPITDAGPDGPSEKWVMKVDLNPGHIAGGSGGQYFLGEFDGTTFTPDEPTAPLPRWVDWGQDFYCATTFHAADDDQGRPLWLGWMNNWNYATELPTFPWRGSMTIPRRLELTESGDGRLALTQRLPQQVTDMADDATRLDDLTGRDGPDSSPDDPGLPPAFLLDVEPPDEGSVTLGLVDGDGTVVAEVFIDVSGDAVQIVRPDESNAGPDGFAGATPPAPLGSGPVTVLVDRASVEVLADQGRTSITSLILPIAEIADVTVHGDGVADGAIDVRLTGLSG